MAGIVTPTHFGAFGLGPWSEPEEQEHDNGRLERHEDHALPAASCYRSVGVV